jgi:hypothetical protein
MPYVKPDVREVLAKKPQPLVAGEINYLVTRACVEATDVLALENKLFKIAENYWLDAVPQNYQAINDVLGAFDGARREWKRRKTSFPFDTVLSRAVGRFYEKYAAEYEDSKLKMNGDVYN